jgi:hypothetical protein
MSETQSNPKYRTVTLAEDQLDRIMALAQLGFRSLGYNAGVARDRDLAALRGFGEGIEWTMTAEAAQAALEDEVQA